MSKNHAVVAGGAGFIGRHLVKRLLKEGYDVTVLDNLASGRRNALPPNPRLRFRLHDVTKPIPGFDDVSLVVHLASLAVPEQYKKAAIQTLEVGALGTRNLLELAAKHKASFLLASTSEVYGNRPPSTRHGFSEQDSVLLPPPNARRGCYAVAKRFAEQLTVEYARSMKLSAAVIRLFNIYGPGMDDGPTSSARVIPAFVRSALCGEPLPIYGDGLQTRSFCWVDDAVDAIVLLARQPLSGEIFNLGSTEEHTVQELAALVESLLGKQQRIKLKRDQFESHQRRPDTRNLRSRLTWSPKIGLLEGLKLYIEHLPEETRLVPGTTIVVPSFGRVDGVGRLLAALDSLEPAPEAVVIVDDATPGGPPRALVNWSESADNYRPRLVVQSKNQGPAAARNQGLSLVDTEYVAFTDNDCEPAYNWIKVCETRLDNEPIKVAGVGGRIVARQQDLLSRYYVQQRILEPPLDCSYLVTANAVYRTDLVLGVGGFDVGIKTPGGEDPGLSFSLAKEGFRFVYDEQAIVKHDFRGTIVEFLTTFYRYGRGCAHVFRVSFESANT